MPDVESKSDPSLYWTLPEWLERGAPGVLNVPEGDQKSSSVLRVEDWGLISYQEALERQMNQLEKVKMRDGPDTLIFCSHPPVVTCGRATQSEDIFAWSGEVAEVSRGGRVTYHGPSQLITYPILHLDRDHGEFLIGKDVHSYLRCLETIWVETLKLYGIPALARQFSLKESNSEMTLTGVWVGDKKIASIGVAVRSWITYHGVALNVDYDPLAFQGIKPCGMSADTMISMEEILGEKVDRKKLMRYLLLQCQKYFF